MTALCRSVLGSLASRRLCSASLQLDPLRVAHGSPGSSRIGADPGVLMPSSLRPLAGRTEFCPTLCDPQGVGASFIILTQGRGDPGLPCTTRKGSKATASAIQSRRLRSHELDVARASSSSALVANPWELRRPAGCSALVAKRRCECSRGFQAPVGIAIKSPSRSDRMTSGRGRRGDDSLQRIRHRVAAATPNFMANAPGLESPGYNHAVASRRTGACYISSPTGVTPDLCTDREELNS